MLFCIPMAISAQPNFSANHIETLKLAIDDFIGYDQYGSSYYIKNNVLVKSSENSKLEYNNLTKGRISHVDITNPLMIVIFYADFNSVVFLDNQLNVIREIEFSKVRDQLLVGGGGLAEQNKLWLFDSQMQQILLYDFAGNQFRTLSIPLRNGIDYYETSLTAFKWIDRSGQVFSCDVYGEVKSVGKMPKFDSVRFATDNSVFFTESGKLYFTDFTKDKIIDIPSVGNSVSKFYYKDQILAIFTTSGLTKFQITLP